MKRTRKLLAAFVPPVVTGVAGVAVGVWAVSGGHRSIGYTPASGPKVVGVRETEPANNDQEIKSAADAITGVLPPQDVDRPSLLTRNDLSGKLPTVKPALLEPALDYLKKEGNIIVFNDKGTLRYGKPTSHTG